MTKQYRDEIDALNDLRHELKKHCQEARLAPAGNGWVLFTGDDDMHAVSYCELGNGEHRFNVHEGPSFHDAEEAAFSIANFDSDGLQDEREQHEVILLLAKVHFGATALDPAGAIYRALAAAFAAGKGG